MRVGSSSANGYSNPKSDTTKNYYSQRLLIPLFSSFIFLHYFLFCVIHWLIYSCISFFLNSFAYLFIYLFIYLYCSHFVVPIPHGRFPQEKQAATEQRYSVWLLSTH